MTNTTPLRFPAALSAVTGETRRLLPSRPGLPGQPALSYETASAWMADVKATALVLGEGRLDLAEAAILDGNPERGEVYLAEARALVALGTSA